MDAKEHLLDTNSENYVLGCLMRDPLLLQEDGCTLSERDFGKIICQLVFSVVYNMAQSGVQSITPQDIDRELKQYSTQYAYYADHGGLTFIQQSYDLANSYDDAKYGLAYDRIKKFAVLRELDGAGIDIKQFYDESNILDKNTQDEKFNKLSVESIINTIRSKLVTIENEHIGKGANICQSVDKNLSELVQSLEKQPEVGLPIDGSIINYAVRGARLGKLYIYSAPSGAGKTRFLVGNACSLSMPYLDNEAKVVIRGTKENPDYRKVLFITTEQQVDEIQTLVLSYVSGVNEKNILLGTYTPDEKGRIEKAIEVINKFGHNLIIECIPDPSIAMLKTRLIKYIIQDDINYIFYDYIFSSPGLLNEFRDLAIREDVALMMLSNSLKEIASTYNVFIQSATQLNDGWSKKTVGLRDQNCIRGSKAIADKIDIGAIGVRISEDERKEIDAVLKELRNSNPTKFVHEPNIVIDIYKNRRGELNCVKVFRYFDYGTCRAEDMFITDGSYNLIAGQNEFQYQKEAIDFLNLKTIEEHEKVTSND
jgi:replicative DNA helicase